MVINPSIGMSGMYIPILMVPIMGWMTINNAPCFDQIHMVIYAGRMTILIFQENVVVIVVVLITFIIAVALTATTLGHGIG